MNPEFSQRPFAVGSLIGVRSFRVTEDGTLTGVSAQEPWKPGINEAICAKPSTGIASAMARIGVSAEEAAWSFHRFNCAMRGVVNLRKRPKPKPLPIPPEVAPHQAGTLDCTCGFYAYFDEAHNPHHYVENVLGIIEGFGVCTTGTRGFRSSKARLRALVFDARFRAYDQGGRASRIAARYPGVPIFQTLAAALAEFPLTPVEGAERPEPPVVVGPWGNYTMTLTVDTSAWDRAVKSLIRAYGTTPNRISTDGAETPRERALRLRRERNTGPGDQRRLDGRRARG